MDEAAFWNLIGRLDWDHEGDDDAVVEPVVSALVALPETEIAEFQRILTEKLYAIDGRAWARESGSEIWWGDDSLSVDGFLYARCVVVANGPALFEAVLKDPRKMPKDVEFEALLYVAPTAFERKTGRDYEGYPGESEGLPAYETFSNPAGWT
jgi:hypothetical protein